MNSKQFVNWPEESSDRGTGGYSKWYFSSDPSPRKKKESLQGYLNQKIESSSASSAPSVQVNMARQAALDARQTEFEGRLNKIQEDIESLVTNIDAETKKLRQINKEVKDDMAAARQQISALEREAKRDKLQAIQILALFVAFFTFVSIQF